MDTRRLSDLIQEILPAEFSSVVFTEAAETKDSTLTVKIKNRLEYGVLHEITQEFHLKGALAGYNRMAEATPSS